MIADKTIAVVLYDDSRLSTPEFTEETRVTFFAESLLVSPTPHTHRDLGQTRSFVPPEGVSLGKALNLAIGSLDADYIVLLEASCVPDSKWEHEVRQAVSAPDTPQAFLGETDVLAPWGASSFRERRHPEHHMIVRKEAFDTIGGFSSDYVQALGVDLLWRMEEKGFLCRTVPSLRCSRSQPITELSQSGVPALIWSREVCLLNDRYSALLPKSTYLRHLSKAHTPWQAVTRAAKTARRSLKLQSLGKNLLKGHGSRFAGLAHASEDIFEALGMTAGILERTRPGILMAPDWRMNPYQSLFYRGLVDRGFSVTGVRDIRPETLLKHATTCRILHLHWIEGICRIDEPNLIEAVRDRLRWAQFLGYQIIWTIHNEHIHDTRYPELDRVVRHEIAQAAKLLIVHSELSRKNIISTYHIDPQRVVCMPHGTYLGAYNQVRSGAAQRALLGIPSNAPCMLHLGLIRPYKGLEAFIPLWLKVAKPDWRLVIAGQPKPEDMENRLREKADGDSRVLFEFGRIADNELRSYLEMSDIVVLPYERILTSGSALLASSYNRRIIAPKYGALPEVYTDFPELASLYDPNEGPEAALRAWGSTSAQALEPNVLAAFKRFHERYAWSQVSEEVIRRVEDLHQNTRTRAS